MKQQLIDRLYKLKTRANLTSEDIAERMYVSESTVSRWFSGRITPSIDQLEQLVGVLGGDMTDIFTAVGKQEMLAAQDKGYEGVESITMRYEAQLEAMRERIALCDSHHSTEMQIMQESCDRTLSRMEHELHELEQHNAELLARAIRAEERADAAERRAEDLHKRRTHLLIATLVPLVLVSIALVVCHVADLPHIGMGW